MLEDSIYETIRGFIAAKAYLDCGSFMGELPLRDIGQYRRRHFKGPFVRVEELADGSQEGACRRDYGQPVHVERRYFNFILGGTAKGELAASQEPDSSIAYATSGTEAPRDSDKSWFDASSQLF
jgi:hypothetical protein